MITTISCCCRYFMVSPTSQYTHAWEWISKHLPEDGSVQISDVSSKYVVMNLIGPKSRDVLHLLTDADVDNFPYFTSQVCIKIFMINNDRYIIIYTEVTLICLY